MAYARIEEGFWTDPKIKSLPLEGKMVAAWLFTNPHRHFSGLYYLPIVLIPHEIGVSVGVSEKILNVLEEQGFIKYSHEFSVVWVINMLRHQAGCNGAGKLSSQQIKGIENHLSTLHGCPLIEEFTVRYKGLGVKYGGKIDTPIDTPIDIKSQSQSQSKSQSQSQSQEKDLSAKNPPTTPAVRFTVNDLALLWNEKKPPELASVHLPLKRPDKDMGKIKDALKRNPEREWWEQVVVRLQQSPHCRGNNDRGWKASFDFMVTRAEVILDGKYDGGGGRICTQPGIEAWLRESEPQGAEIGKQGQG